MLSRPQQQPHQLVIDVRVNLWFDQQLNKIHNNLHRSSIVWLNSHWKVHQKESLSNLDAPHQIQFLLNLLFRTTAAFLSTHEYLLFARVLQSTNRLQVFKIAVEYSFVAKFLQTQLTFRILLCGIENWVNSVDCLVHSWTWPLFWW